MIFQSGIYYVGDPGDVLPNDDLRMLFRQLMRGKLKNSGPREIVTPRDWVDKQIVCGIYWLYPTPNREGTLYDQNGRGWGFDWGCFGLVPWEWVENPKSYLSNKIEFTDSFECSSTEDSITIGHLHFTFNPK